MLDVMTCAVSAKIALLASETSTAAHDDCPVCGSKGSLQSELANERGHVHSWCENEGCGAEVVE